MNYLPFVDGLRAIAIVAVVGFHAVPRTLPGGFAGVDLFFVISGFLITRIISHEMTEGKFSFLQFLLRRARRLLPAAVACFSVTTVISYLVLLPVAFHDFGRSLMATMGMYANVFFYRISGYFSPQAFEMPLLHTWSLALEDQFYLTWPLVLLLMVRALPRALVRPLVGSLLAVSLAIAVYSASSNPDAAFFLLPSRAWELLSGCLLGLAPLHFGERLPGRLAEMIGLAGAAAVASSFLLLDATSAMPGLAAVPLCAGGLAVIASSLQHETLVRRALSTLPVVFVGRISYSLYLWHWPLLSLASYSLERQLTTAEALSVVAVSAGLAVASWSYVEQPFRVSRSGAAWPSNGRFVLAGAAAAIALMIAGNAIKALDGLPGRYRGRVGEVLSEMNSVSPHRKHCDGFERVFADAELCNVGRPKARDASYDAALFGDSMAEQWVPLLEEAARQHGWAARQVTHGGCAFFGGLDLPAKAGRAGRAGECASYQGQALRFIEANPGLKLAIVSAFWRQWQARLDRDHRDANVLGMGRRSVAPAITDYSGPGFEQAFLSMLEVFRKRGIKVHIIGPLPDLRFGVRCVVKAVHRGQDAGLCSVRAQDGQDSLRSIDAFFARVAVGDPGISYARPIEFMCSGEVCPPVIDGVFVYRSDGTHLNDAGARVLAARVLPASMEGGVAPNTGSVRDVAN
jgi:peptidoglycan/LPS O-acetylase OafA/YrhL